MKYGVAVALLIPALSGCGGSDREPLEAFHLAPVERLYQDAYGRDEGIIILGLHTPVPSWRFPGLGYAFDLTYTFE